MGTAIKHPMPSRVKLSFERQSARTSKITNDGLTRSGTRCFIAVPIMVTMGVEGLIIAYSVVTVIGSLHDIMDIAAQLSSVTLYHWVGSVVSGPPHRCCWWCWSSVVQTCSSRCITRCSTIDSSVTTNSTAVQLPADITDALL